MFYFIEPLTFTFLSINGVVARPRLREEFFRAIRPRFFSIFLFFFFFFSSRNKPVVDCRLCKRAVDRERVVRTIRREERESQRELFVAFGKMDEREIADSAAACYLNSVKLKTYVKQIRGSDRILNFCVSARLLRHAHALARYARVYFRNYTRRH